MGSETPAELERVEERNAWREYFVDTHDLATDSPRYEEVEASAWARLSQRLKAISDRRRRRLAVRGP